MTSRPPTVTTDLQTDGTDGTDGQKTEGRPRAELLSNPLETTSEQTRRSLRRPGDDACGRVLNVTLVLTCDLLWSQRHKGRGHTFHSQGR